MRIFVVEDEHLLANSIKKGLVQEKHAVDVAYTGPDGLDLAVSEDYDLVILDLMLPGLDGLSVCRQLRAKSIHTPVLILTARGQIGDKVTGLDAGADDYLTKPFSFAELLARIRALSRRPKKVIPPVLDFDGLSLNPQTFDVARDNKQISLSGKEFSLLEYFLRHPRQILTKDRIISHVWDYDADVLPNTVEVYVKSLRHKIGSDLIQTVRGFGYKLDHV